MTLRTRLAVWFVPITLALVFVPWWLTQPINNTSTSSQVKEASGQNAVPNAPVAAPASTAPSETDLAAPAPVAPAPTANAEMKARTTKPQPTTPTTRGAVAPTTAPRAEDEPAQAMADTARQPRDHDARLQQLDALKDREGPVLLRYQQGQLEILENPPTTPSSTPWVWGGVLLAGAWLVGAWGIRRSLTPLYDLAAEIAQRNPKRLDALESPPLPELRPAVTALNALLEELRETLSRLELQEQSAKRFAYNASHELRNPLTAARNYLEVLERHPGERDAASKALEAVTRTEKVLSSLLTLARLEGRGHVRGERVDLRSFLEANFELSVLGDATVWAERDLLELAIDNIVKNADEYAGGVTQARIEATPSGVWIWLEDNGTGFPKAILERAFEPFVKGGSSTGLGLAIVDAVAKAHSGEARAENQPDRGARVGLRLPSAAP